MTSIHIKVAKRYIQAGIFEYPPQLHQDIMSWLESIWGEVKGWHKSKSKSKRFKVTESSLRGWRYYDDLSRRFPDELKGRLRGSVFTVSLKFNLRGSNTLGVMEGLYKLTLNVDSYTRLRDVSDTLEHELTHWGQNFMKGVLALGLKHTKSEPGQPSRSISDNGDLDLSEIKSPYIRNQVKHDLQDKEFYPELRSTLREFTNYLDDLIEDAENYLEDPDNPFNEENNLAYAKAIYSSLDALVRFVTRVDSKPSSKIPSYAIRHFQGIGNDLFTTAKKYSPQKWKKAVGIFVNAVRPYYSKGKWRGTV